MNKAMDFGDFRGFSFNEETAINILQFADDPILMMVVARESMEFESHFKGIWI